MPLIGRHRKGGLFGDSFAHLPTEMFRCDIFEKFPSKTHMYCFVIPRHDTSKGWELRRALHGRTTFDTPCILQPEVQIALLPSLFPI